MYEMNQGTGFNPYLVADELWFEHGASGVLICSLVKSLYWKYYVLAGSEIWSDESILLFTLNLNIYSSFLASSNPLCFIWKFKYIKVFYYV